MVMTKLNKLQKIMADSIILLSNSLAAGVKECYKLALAVSLAE